MNIGSLILSLAMTLTVLVSSVVGGQMSAPASTTPTVETSTSYDDAGPTSSPASTSSTSDTTPETAPSTTSTPTSSEVYSERLRELHERERGQSLGRHPGLAAYASWHLQRVVCDSALWHSSSEDLITQNPGFRRLGENLALGFASPDEAHAAYMASPGHAENVLFPTWTHMEVASGVCPSWGNVYTVTIFGEMR